MPRVVDDDSLEHRGIRDPDVVAVGRDQNGRTRCQFHHVTLVFVDLDEIVDLERIAQTEQDAGDIVLDRIAHRKTHREPDDAGSTEDRSK